MAFAVGPARRCAPVPHPVRRSPDCPFRGHLDWPI